MALGFGFNKAKVMNAAEKCVQQGKLQNAINEYEKVVRQDPKELGVINTIGDLYARLGQAERASACFRRVGESYAQDGFTVKAIAMFKKLTKVNPGQLDAVLKLAELYTQQGLYNDARQQYVIVAEHCLRNNNTTGAAAVFQKMLELDPENAAVQTKLADLYIQMGKSEEARDIYFRAAESLHVRGALDAAEEALAKVIKLEPGNTRALLQRAQVAFDQGDPTSTVRHLQQVPKLDTNPDGLALLLRARLQAGQTAEAEVVARTLATLHKDLSGIQVIAEAQVAAGSVDKALALYQEFSAQLGNDTLARVLEPAIAKAKDDIATLEIVRGLAELIGSKTHIIESTEALANALVVSGDLRRACDLYAELAKTEPENPHHQQHYRQVLTKLGEDAMVRPLSPHEAVQAFVVDELEISAPAVEQEYPAEIEEAIKAALTDSELLDSYNLPAKALAPLEKVLPMAPRDARLNQRLASLYAGANRFADAAACCEALQQIYRASGHMTEARQYGEMAAKYRAAAPAAPFAAALAAQEPETAPETAVEVEIEAAAAPEAAAEFRFEVAVPTAEAAPAPVASHELDISDEWQTTLEPVAVEVNVESPAVTPLVAEIAAEARFYISQGMWQEAQAACRRLAAVDPEYSGLPDLKAQLAAAVAPTTDDFAAAMQAARAAAAAASTIPQPVFRRGAAEEAAAAEAPAEVAPEVAAEEPAPAAPSFAEPEKAAAAVASSGGDVLGAFVSDLEESLPVDFGVAAPPPPAPTIAVTAAAAAAMPAPVIESSKPLIEAVSAPPAETPASAEAALLEDMFAEFKEEAESGQQAGEDPETHYNLGVAFREMALLDEAIGELQKVCGAIDKGAPFRDVMQVYTLLAQCFVDKGVPEASVKWYEKALTVPCDQEQRLALHYELASAYEAGGNKTAALQHFMEVYGSNIDYRDVADRIKALRT